MIVEINGTKSTSVPEFAREIGYSDYVVRVHMKALGIEPVGVLHRTRLYADQDLDRVRQMLPVKAKSDRIKQAVAQ